MIIAVIKRITLFFVAIAVLISTPFIWFNYQLETSPKIEENYPRVVMVLGASVLSPTEPSLVLKKRLDVASDLYNNDLVEKILVSGDNRASDYNEPLTMINYLDSKGVDKGNIVADYAGVRTIESCWRAKNVFNIDRMYLVTQRFHLPRAVFLCEQFGIETIPLIANDSSNQVSIRGYIREIPASFSAILESGSFSSKYEIEGDEPDLGIY